MAEPSLEYYEQMDFGDYILLEMIVHGFGYATISYTWQNLEGKAETDTQDDRYHSKEEVWSNCINSLYLRKLSRSITMTVKQLCHHTGKPR